MTRERGRVRLARAAAVSLVRERAAARPPPLAQVSLDDRLSRRRYGWSTSGEPCRRGGVWHQGQHYSALGVFWIGGMLDCFIVKGSIDADLFYLAVAMHLAPHVQAFPRARSVVLADNCITHHFDRWIDDLAGKGTIVTFTEPLAPTTNPIEDAFKLARMWSRDHCDRLCDFASPEAFMRSALMSVGYESARHCIHNCSTFGGMPVYEGMLARFDAGERAPP